MKHARPLLSLVLAAALGLPAPAAPYARPETPAARPAGVNDDIVPLLRQGNHFYNRGRYEEALIKARAALAIDATNAEALDLKRRCEEALEARRRHEQSVFERACATGTLEALQQFVKDNPANQYVPAARERIADFARWDRTRTEGTMEAYERYLATSPTKAFEKEVRAAMLLIEAEQVWKSMEGHYTAEGLQIYLTSYPDSPHHAEAAARLDELNGMAAYRRGDYENAYRLLGRARDEITLTLEASHAYNTATDEHDYAAALRTGTMEAWRGYVAGHPRGRHMAEARDAMALLLLNDLTPYSTESEMTTCRTMATTDATRSRIDARVATLRSLRRSVNRHMRRRAHRRWWSESLTGGIEMGIDFNKDLMSLAGGALVKLGHPGQAVNLETGLRYQYYTQLEEEEYYVYDSYYSSTRSADLAGHFLTVPVYLDINVCHVGSRSKLFIGGGMEFAFLISDGSAGYGGDMFNDINMAWQARLGISSPHCYISCFYKRFLPEQGLLIYETYAAEHMGGLSLAFYF